MSGGGEGGGAWWGWEKLSRKEGEGNGLVRLVVVSWGGVLF